MYDSFTVTKDHITLLKLMYVSWDDCEYGAPCIDPKRPYGNSSVAHDIAEILEWELSQAVLDGDEDFPDELYDKARTIHEQMQTVLQILVSNLGIREGTYYKREKYDATSYEFSGFESV
jgi:hypothetical protein